MYRRLSNLRRDFSSSRLIAMERFLKRVIRRLDNLRYIFLRRREMFSDNRIKITTLLTALFLFCVPAFAQVNREERGLNCDSNWNGDRESYCVMKEQTIPATGGTILVDGRKNGGVTVKGWERGEIFVRWKIQAWADTEAEAKSLADQIRIETGGTKIHAEGPDAARQTGWSVSYEVFVPHNSNL